MSTVEVDKGWAWGAPVAGFIANFIIGGFAKSYGILITGFRELFGCSMAALTATGGLIYTVMYILSIVSHLLSERFGARVVLFVGGIGSAVSLVGASFSPNVYVFCVFMGAGLGLSWSMVYSPVFVMTGRCFRRYIGLANGINTAGVGVGQVVFPFIVQYFVNKYTVRGATMIGGAITLNFLVAAALMPRYVIDPAIQSASSASKLAADNKEVEVKPKNGNHTEEKTMPLDDHSVVNGKTLDLENTIPSLSLEEKYPTWLAHRLLAVFVIAKLLADIGDVGAAFILPSYGKELGLTTAQIPIALSVAGVFDLCSRLFIGWISDRPGVRRSGLLLLIWVVEGINSIALAWVTGFPMFVVSYSIFGMCSGGAMTLMIPIISDFVGPERMPRSFGITMGVVGLVIAVGQFVVGYIRDVTGTSMWSFIMIGIMMLISSVFLLIEYPLRMYYAKHPKETHDTELKSLPIQCNGTSHTKEEVHLNNNTHTSPINKNTDKT